MTLEPPGRGNGDFSDRIVPASEADGAASVFSIDVDGDGDADVLSASRNDNRIAWYENNGRNEFTARTITSSADAAVDVFGIDVDGDGRRGRTFGVTR